MTSFARTLRTGLLGLDPWEELERGRPVGTIGLGVPARLIPPWAWWPGAGAASVEPIPEGRASIATLKACVVKIAEDEWERWGRGKKKESDKAMADVLADYWLTGVGVRMDPKNFTNKAWQDGHPWSAAFISWVMRKAGAGDRFKYSMAHATYVHWAKINREEGSESPFKAYRLGERAPEPGDLVCKARAGSGATYDTIKPGMKTHCDYVIRAENGRLVTIGGNTEDSVSVTSVALDSKGFVKAQGGYFAVVKIEEQTPA